MNQTSRNVLIGGTVILAGHFFHLKAPWQKAAASDSPSTKIVWVKQCHDGDTCRVITENGIQMTLRFAGIDAPEVSKFGHKGPGQSFGTEAKAYVKKRVEAKHVTIKILGNDRYSRYLALLFPEASQKSLNEEMVENGFAFAYRGKQENEALKNKMIVLERQAKRNRVGLWGLKVPPEDPSAFRHRR